MHMMIVGMSIRFAPSSKGNICGQNVIQFELCMLPYLHEKGTVVVAAYSDRCMGDFFTFSNAATLIGELKYSSFPK